MLGKRRPAPRVDTHAFPHIVDAILEAATYSREEHISRVLHLRLVCRAWGDRIAQHFFETMVLSLRDDGRGWDLYTKQRQRICSSDSWRGIAGAVVTKLGNFARNTLKLDTPARRWDTAVLEGTPLRHTRVLQMDATVHNQSVLELPWPLDLDAVKLVPPYRSIPAAPTKSGRRRQRDICFRHTAHTKALVIPLVPAGLHIDDETPWYILPCKWGYMDRIVVHFNMYSVPRLPFASWASRWHVPEVHAVFIRLGEWEPDSRGHAPPWDLYAVYTALGSMIYFNEATITIVNVSSTFPASLRGHSGTWGEDAHVAFLKGIMKFMVSVDDGPVRPVSLDQPDRPGDQSRWRDVQRYVSFVTWEEYAATFSPAQLKYETQPFNYDPET